MSEDLTAEKQALDEIEKTNFLQLCRKLHKDAQLNCDTFSSQRCFSKVDGTSNECDVHKEEVSCWIALM